MALNKTCTSHKDDHHNRHLSSNTYQIYLLAQTNPITSITSLCLTILPFLFAAPTHYPATCHLPFNTYYLLLILSIPTAPAYYLTTSYLLFTTCSCSWLLLLIALPLTTCCVVCRVVRCCVMLSDPKRLKHGNLSGATPNNTYPLDIFYQPPLSLSNPPQLEDPPARSSPQRLLDTLSDRYRTTALESNGRRSLIYHILRFIKEQDL